MLLAFDVVICIDGSQKSMQALKVATDLFDKRDRLLVVHVKSKRGLTEQIEEEIENYTEHKI